MVQIVDLFPPVDRRGGGGDDGGMEASTFATKVELAELRGDMRSSFAEVRSDLHKISSDISRWMLGTVLTVVGTVVLGFIGVAFALFNAAKPATPSTPQLATQAPIVIYATPPATAASKP